MAEAKIRMRTSMVGSIDWEQGRELVVGVEVEEGLARALCTQPADDPRAEAIGWDPWKEEPVAKQAKQGVERATAPQQEKRETAVLPRRRRTVKPPKPSGGAA